MERDADLHMAQLMPLPLIVSCFGKIQIGFTFLVPSHLAVPDKGPLNGCVYVLAEQKLVAALLRVAMVTASLAESNGSLPPGL